MGVLKEGQAAQGRQRSGIAGGVGAGQVSERRDGITRGRVINVVNGIARCRLSGRVAPLHGRRFVVLHNRAAQPVKFLSEKSACATLWGTFKPPLPVSLLI